MVIILRIACLTKSVARATICRRGRKWTRRRPYTAPLYIITIWCQRPGLRLELSRS